MNGETKDSRPYATCDQEAWVKDRIRGAINMALAVKDCHRVSAENGMVEGAIRGIVNAAAVEIINTMGHRPSYINLRDLWKVP